MNLVVGATGVLGGRIAHLLLSQGEPVKVLVRRSSDWRSLEAAGAELAFGDLKDRRTLPGAYRDVTRVVSTATASMRGGEDTIEAVDLRGTGHLIDQAARFGVDQFVYVSAHGLDPDSGIPLARAKHRSEERLRESGVPFTILRPTLFMEAWIGYLLGNQLERGSTVTLLGDGETRHGFVSLEDVAGLAVAVLGDDGALDSTLPFTGPDVVSYREIVEMIREVTGRDIRVHSVPADEAPRGMPEVVVQLWRHLNASGDLSLDTADVADRYDLAPTGVRAFVESTFAPT